MGILDRFVTSFAEVCFDIILTCSLASFWVFDNSSFDIALYLMVYFELEAYIEL